MSPLPKALSPSSNVRRSCQMKMKETLISSLCQNSPSPTNEMHPNDNDRKPRRTVAINPIKLSKLANQIFESMLQNHQTKKSLDFIEWDEHGWHYTGESYIRKNQDWSHEKKVAMRVERIILYILALDAMNFCFWPAHPEDTTNPMRDNLEYHHLAIALKHIAEMDDDILQRNDSKSSDTSHDEKNLIQSESTYRLSPQVLSQITPSELQTLLSPHLPSNLTQFPNLEQRCRLLNELGWGLRHFYSSSATCLLQKAGRSADKLVFLLLSSFSGFRDEAVDEQGKIIYFYKRAQIAVADLKAALGKYTFLADFTDMESLTTFADYRVPQLLRHEHVLEYAPELGKDLIDKKIEISAGNSNEIYIRAATVVAVDMLVQEVNSLVMNWIEENGKTTKDSNNDIELLNAVKIDWYLWQLGESLENEQKMSFHHRVRTIYY